MTTTTRVPLHSDGPLLWPEHWSLEEIQEKEDKTPADIWSAEYMLEPTPPGGAVFLQKWWMGQNRYDFDDVPLKTNILARFISWDTAETTNETSAYTACVIGDLMRDYRLLIRGMERQRVLFPELMETIPRVSGKWNRDKKLRGVIIENASSGVAALQSLTQTGEMWHRRLLAGFNPDLSKLDRAKLASVWCKNGMVWLPYPSDSVEWLYDLESDLFSFPGSTFKDVVDAFTQLVRYLENYLERGYHGRNSQLGAKDVASND